MLEWSNGPTAPEARQVLMSSLVDSGSRDLRADDLGLDPTVGVQRQDENFLILQVHGVAVQFRSLAPIGWHVTQEKRLTELRSISSKASKTDTTGKESLAGVVD